MKTRHVTTTSLVAALLVLAAWRPAAAQTGKIQVEVLEAEAQHKGNDACVGPWCNEQDFFVRVAYPPYLIWQRTAEVGNRDRPAWSFVASGNVSKLQRYHDIRVQLWDKDDPMWSSDDLFDISPLAHHELYVHFDACNQTWEEIGLPTRHGPGRSYPPFGTFYSNQDHEFDGRVVLDVHTEGRIPFTTNDIAIVGIDPVQVAFDPGSVVSGKPTAMRVTIASTYTMPTPAPAPVTVTVTDGISTWTETRSVIIPQGLSTFYFFDGMEFGSTPFYPIKPSYTDIAFLTYSVSLVYNDVAPAGTAPDFIDCYQYNNSLNDKQTPLVRTSAPDPVFVRWDWLDSMNVPSLPAMAQMAQRDEDYREATWPLAQTSPVISGATLGTFWNPTDLLTWVSEPYRSLAGLSIGAKLGGIDRMVLVTRKGWFSANNWRSWIWPTNSIGLSLGEFGPHAVIVEEGTYAVSTHELGHTYTLSRRKCSHDDMNAGCRDEYTISAAEGAPFLARGLDVLGSIFPAGSPTGSVDAVTGCATARPGTREVCRKNLMDVQTPGSFNNWTDTFTLNFLTDTLKNPADPELINLSGWVHTTNGWSPTQAPIFEGSLDFSYHSFGMPDLEDPLSMTPARPFSGLGPFSIHLTGDTGERIYRFTPSFASEGESVPREGAYFSIFVPWDPTIFRVALYAPLDIRNGECEDRTCAEMLLFERYAAPRPPIIVALEAGRDTAPSLVGGPRPHPWIESGHDAVIAWNAIDVPIGSAGGASPAGASSPTPQDAGTGALRAVLLLRRAGAAGGPGSTGAAEPWLPYAFETTGSEVRIPYALLADAPGDYAAQLIVSNGLQSSTFTSEALFHVVQGSGCQADPTPGAPCDDGDACTGNDQCVQDPFAGIICRGTPVNCDDNDACTVDSCNPTGVCVLPDNGEGTADLPPQGCGYSSLDPLMIISGLPPGSTIHMAAVLGGFTCPAAPGVCSFALPSPGVDCDAPGGTLGGEEACAASVLKLQLTGTGALSGFNRTLSISAGLEIHAAPRTSGDPVQSFDADIFRMQGQLPVGDPDFDLLRITAGDDFSLPSPGHTTLTRQSSGDWDVDSFVDTTYRIDFIGKPGGTLTGMSGSTTGTIRLRTGGGACTHAPVACDDGNPCTVDSCDPATGACRFVPTPGASCNDGDACTEDDRCFQSPTGGISCQGVAVDCDDGDSCTRDTCVSPTGCVHSPKDCDDRDVCTADSCQPQACAMPDNGAGTADLPPHCPYNAQDRLAIQEADGTILFIEDVQLRSFTCPPGPGPAVCSFPSPVPGVDCSQPGGSLGGEEACANAVFTLRITLFNPITFQSYSRSIDLPVSLETHAAPRTPYDPVQSFSTDLFRLSGQITMDPDFDLLRITAGTDFGMTSPGHTTLSKAGSGWGVDSFFDVSLRIDGVRAQAGRLPLNGSLPWTVRFRTGGGCVHVPTNCDDGDACTTDSCDPETGACRHVARTCDDGDACTSDSCDPSTGQCRNVPLTCDDNNACTVNDHCVPTLSGGTTCQGDPKDCHDGDPCTDDICVPTSGQCLHTATNCDDGDACTSDACAPLGCIVPDNGAGTADLPAAACPLRPEGNAKMMILNGLSPTASIEIDAVHSGFTCPAVPSSQWLCSFPSPVPGVDCSQGSPAAGEQSCGDSTLTMHMVGTGTLAGFVRDIPLGLSLEERMNPRVPGTPVQSFDTQVFRLFGQLPAADQDFDLLRLVGGTDFGLPSPGHTVLTQMGGNWGVDSVFDITYRIDFVGAIGSPLAGRSGSTTGTIRFRTAGGQCVHTPVGCDDGNACTTDFCDPASGQCSHNPIGCDDHDACTLDSCNPQSGCTHQPAPPAGEPSPARFESQVSFTWPASPNATHWNTYRGTIPTGMLGSRLPALVYDQACFESADTHGDGAMVATDVANPPRGTAFYYLMSGEANCGESAIGHASSGATIPNTLACPTPP